MPERSGGPNQPPPASRPTAGATDNRRRVALTFDDGPSKSEPSDTLRLMDHLAYFERLFGVKIKATFFLQGICIDPRTYDDNPVIRANREGHLIANHGFSHTSFLRLSRDNMIDEIKRTNDLIQNLGVPAPRYFRAPYGEIDTEVLPGVLEEMNMEHVGWDVDARDWNRDDAQNPRHAISKRVIEGVLTSKRPTTIVLFHDGPDTRSKTIDAIDCIVPVLFGLKYEFVTVDDLAPGV